MLKQKYVPSFSIDEIVAENSQQSSFLHRNYEFQKMEKATFNTIIDRRLSALTG